MTTGIRRRSTAPRRLTARGGLPAGAMAAGGLLWAAAFVADSARGEFPVVVFIGAVLLVGLSLPGCVRPSQQALRPLAAAGTVTALCGLALVVLFNLQIALLIGDWFGVAVSDGAMSAGRRLVPVAVGAGLLALASAWDRTRGAVVLRAVLAVVGAAGVAVGVLGASRVFITWYLALSLAWLLLGVAAWPARRTAST